MRLIWLRPTRRWLLVTLRRWPPLRLRVLLPSWLAASKGVVLKPSIGRVVHYHSYGTPNGEYVPEPRAAIVTVVYDEPPHLADPDELHVGLAVLNPTGVHFNQLVPYSEVPKSGYWSWPPRV